MAHELCFKDGLEDLLSVVPRERVVELVDLYYRWGDNRFEFGPLADRGNPLVRGQHIYDGSAHLVSLAPWNMRDHFKRGLAMGGDKMPRSLAHAMCLVVVHELQHANQHGERARRDASFRSGPYKGRANERDARAFADSKHDELWEFVNDG